MDLVRKLYKYYINLVYFYTGVTRIICFLCEYNGEHTILPTTTTTTKSHGLRVTVH